MRRHLRFTYAIVVSAVGTAALIGAGGTPTLGQTAAAGPVVKPTISNWQFITAGTPPPTQAACNAVVPFGRRCFDPMAMANSYDYASLTNRGAGRTIALVDSFGSSTIASDLNNFDTQFGLQHMCGETGVTCTSGMPAFSILNVQGSPPPTPPPPNNGTDQEGHNVWALETSLDVEWAHATAPMANILLVTTPTAETLGVQGFHQMMNAEQYVIDHHLADVISQSFAAAEGSFSSFSSLQNLRHAFISAQANNVTVFGSSGDGGTTNVVKEPVKNPRVIPYPSVEWPASDPLVTGVGGTEFDPTVDVAGTLTGTPPNSNAGATTYWSGTSNFTDTLPSALSYIPEIGWNDSTQTPQRLRRLITKSAASRVPSDPPKSGVVLFWRSASLFVSGCTSARRSTSTRSSSGGCRLASAWSRPSVPPEAARILLAIADQMNKEEGILIAQHQNQVIVSLKRPENLVSGSGAPAERKER